MNTKTAFTKDETIKIKGFAILIMVFHHLFLNPPRYKGYDILFDPFAEIHVNTAARGMKICVALFTFLSAYGISYSYLKSYNNGLDSKLIKEKVSKRLISLISGFMFVFAAIQIYSALVIRQNGYQAVYGKGLGSILFFVIDMLGLAQLFHTPTFINTFWYISLAIVIIVILPYIVMFYKKYGSFMTLSIACVFSMLFPVHVKNSTDLGTYCFLPVYILTICLGIIAADKNMLAKMKEKKLCKNSILNKIIKFILYIAVLAVLFFYRNKSLGTDALPVFEGIIPVILIGFLFEFVNVIPVLSTILKFLGKHSMNIFLIHNFIRYSWYSDKIYSCGDIYTIFLALLLTSLAASIVLELIKKLIRFNDLVDYVSKKVNK